MGWACHGLVDFLELLPKDSLCQEQPEGLVHHEDGTECGTATAQHLDAALDGVALVGEGAGDARVAKPHKGNLTVVGQQLVDRLLRPRRVLPKLGLITRGTLWECFL